MHCCINAEAIRKLSVMIRKIPKELKKVGAKLAEGIGNHWGEGEALALVMSAVLVTFCRFHFLDGVWLEVVCCGVRVTNSDIHDQARGGGEVEAKVGGNTTVDKGHHVGSFSGLVAESFIPIVKTGFCSCGWDATFVGDFGELLGQLVVRDFSGFRSMS